MEKSAGNMAFRNNDNYMVANNKNRRWTVWIIMLLTANCSYTYSFLLPSSSCSLCSTSWRIHHGLHKGKNHVDYVSSLVVKSAVLLQMTNDPNNESNNMKEMSLPLLLNKLNERGIRYPPDATIQDLREIYRKALRNSSSTKNDWVPNNDSTVTNVQYRRIKKKKASTGSSVPTKSFRQSRRTRRSPNPSRRRRTEDEEDDNDRWLFSTKRQRRYQNYDRNGDYDDDFYYEDLPYILQKKTKKLVFDNTARMRKLFQPINDKVRDRYYKQKYKYDENGILNVDYWYYDDDDDDDNNNDISRPRRPKNPRKPQRTRSSSSSSASEQFTNRPSSPYPPKKYRALKKKRKRKKKSPYLLNDRNSLRRTPPALPPSSSTVRNENPYQEAFSKTVLQSTNNHGKNDLQNEDIDSKIKDDDSKDPSCSTESSAKKSERRKRNHDKTKKIYSVYPKSEDMEEDEIYQDLEDLYGKTTAQVIDKFGEFIADVISQDENPTSTSSSSKKAQKSSRPNDQKNDNDSNHDKKGKVNKKRNRNNSENKYWKDRLSERLDYMLGLHEDGNYYRSWQHQMEQQPQGDDVDALDYFDGKTKRKKPKRHRHQKKESELSFWEKDGTLMSLFFGRTPSGQQLTFENFLSVNGSGVNVCTSLFRTTFQSFLLVLSYLCRWASCRGALPQPIIVFILFASAVSAPKRRRLFTVTIAFLTLRTIAEAIHGYIYFDDVDDKHWEEGQTNVGKKFNRNDLDRDDNHTHHPSSKPINPSSHPNRNGHDSPNRHNDRTSNGSKHSRKNKYNTNPDAKEEKDSPSSQTSREETT